MTGHIIIFECTFALFYRNTVGTIRGPSSGPKGLWWTSGSLTPHPAPSGGKRVERVDLEREREFEWN